MAKVLILLLIVLLAGSVFAQSSGYVLLDQAPVPGMLTLGTQLNVSVWDASGGSMILRQRTGTIEKYVRWDQPVRPPEYYIVLRDESCGDYCSWFIWSRDTINKLSGV